MINSDETDINQEAYKPRRERMSVDIGALAQRGEHAYRIIQVLDFDAVIGMDVYTGRTTHLRIDELKPIEGNVVEHVDLAVIADEDWKIAQKRYAAISPLAGKLTIGREEVKERALKLDIGVATLYRWLQRFNATGSVTSLIPKKRGWRPGNRRTNTDAEKVIQEVINDFYLTLQRPSPQKAVTEVLRICDSKGIEAPSHTTVRARIAEIPERDRMRARGHKEKAMNRFTPVPGRFPNADFPLSVVQIDHTEADIVLVDDVHRLAIGRPWITVAIDVYSRTIVGFYLSFDPPSETSVAMCVASTILPKEEWLLTHNIDVQWPVWGVPRTIHVDNGADFRSNGFQRSCLAYGINLEFRPVRTPRYGGHIERLLGTLMSEIHAVPGTTFSSVDKRDGYDSDKEAIMTHSEFEVWLMTLICKVYHQRKHSGIGMPPLKKWELGIFGGGDKPGTGIPDRPVDRLCVLLDFLPSFYRTVQTFGVTIDGLTYYAESLRPWINSLDIETGENKKLLFRRNPRDISSIWFYDPDIKQYFKVPFADQSLPTVSLWEYRQAKERLKKKLGNNKVNERQVLMALTELRDQIAQAKHKSRKARRQSQRRIEHAKPMSQVLPSLGGTHQPKTESHPEQLLQNELLSDDEDINTFGDIA